MCKVAFNLGSLTIYWYGILVAVGMVVGLWTASRFSRRKNIAPDVILDAGVWLIFGGVIGARVYYVLANWQSSFADKPWYEVFMFQKGGLVFYGGLAGGALGAFLFSKIKGLPFMKLADIFALGLPVGHFFGRLGCFMNGCCYGKQTDLPWAVHFPLAHETRGVSVHPTQLYESGLNIMLFLWLMSYSKKTNRDGLVTSCYFMSYSILRFFVEFLRGDYSYEQLIVAQRLTPAQGLSIILFAIGLILHIYSKKKSLEQPVRL